MCMANTILELFQNSHQKIHGSVALPTGEGGANRRALRRRREAPPHATARPTARKSLSAEGAMGWAYNARAKHEKTRTRMLS